MAEKDKNMEIAIFRFGIISELVIGVRLEYGERERIYREKSLKIYNIPYSSSTRVSKSTIKKWVLNYKKSGCRIEGLMPLSRKDSGDFKSFDGALQVAIKLIKNEKPDLTGVALVNELRHRKYIEVSDKINLSTMYRFLKKYELERPKKIKDRRSFEAGSPNELWQSDVLHGPMVMCENNKNKKSYLIAILDDNSRLIPHAQFYLSEKLQDFKECLKNGIEKRGLPQKLYIDNGSCYKALNLEQVTASLGIGIVHTPPYVPQGRGKIERWFRYVRENFFPTCPKELTLNILNELFDDWVSKYHIKIHSITKETPLNKYQRNMKCVRPAPKELLKYFRFIEFRLVKKDRSFRLNGNYFESSIDLIDKRIELKYHRDSCDEVEMFFDGRSYGMATVLDRNINFKIGRNNKKNEIEEVNPSELF